MQKFLVKSLHFDLYPKNCTQKRKSHYYIYGLTNILRNIDEYYGKDLPE